MTGKNLTEIKGMILAAGFGTRMQPLTRCLPKPLLPAAGRSLLEWNLLFLASSGLREVAVNAHHLSAQVLDALRRLGTTEPILAGAAAGPSSAPAGWIIRPHSEKLPLIRLLLEERILGTAGGIAHAAPYLDAASVVVVNVDLLFRPDLSAAYEQHRKSGCLATLLCVRQPLHAQLRLQGDRVVAIHPRPRPDDSELWAFSGIYFLSREAVRRLRAAAACGGGAGEGPGGRDVSADEGRVGFREIIPDFRSWMVEDRLGAVRAAGHPFREAGAPEDYLELLRDISGPRPDLLLDPSASEEGLDPEEPLTVAGYGFIEAGAIVGAGAHVEESAVFSGAVIAPSARVTRSILGPGSAVSGSVEGVIAAGGEIRPLQLLPSAEERRLRPWLEGLPEMVQDRPWPLPLRFRLLHGDGSSRRIARVLGEEKSHVLMIFPPPSGQEGAIYPRRTEAGAPSELDTFLYVAGVLSARGIRVPRIEAVEAKEGWILQEDLGDLHLARAADLRGTATDDQAQGEARGLYLEAVRLLMRMQFPQGLPREAGEFDPSRTHNLPYDAPFILQYEAGYFHREMVRGWCGCDLNFAATLPAYEAVAREALAGAPLVFLHRDFQSRNLMVTARGLAVIDFQGARMGPPEYDLASLLLDPYAALPLAFREDLLESYLEQRITAEPQCDAGRKAILRRYRACGIARTLQVLGAFAFLGGRLGKPGFLEHAPQALEHLKELTAGADSRFPVLREPRFPELAELADQLDRRRQEPEP